jgi:hypothetical protein
MRKTGKPLGLVIVLMIVFVNLSQADTIYSNLGPGLSYGNSAIRAATGSLNLAAATPFVVPSGANYALTEIDLAIGASASAPATIELTDNAGGFPGNVIASWTMNFPALFANSSIVPSQQITGITGITLDENATYWLAVLAANGSTDTWWSANNTGQINIKADSFTNGASWSPLYTQNADVAFGVFGNSEPVPEPSTILLLATAILGMGGAISRFRSESGTISR